MKVGTKSVLFGAHCFLLHGWFVAWAWWTLYGFPADIRLWVAFFVHDLGYWGQPNMDGPEGETHPQLGARIMTALFDRSWKRTCQPRQPIVVPELSGMKHVPGRDGCFVLDVGPWGQFSLLHSRYYAKTLGLQPSRLCVADKLAITLVPAWLYLPMVRATGEIAEYMAHAKHRIDGNAHVTDYERFLLLSSEREWYRGVQSYCRRWVAEHKGGKADTWTSDAKNRATVDETGTWR